jgi:hypothetical protein
LSSKYHLEIEEVEHQDYEFELYLECDVDLNTCTIYYSILEINNKKCPKGPVFLINKMIQRNIFLIVNSCKSLCFVIK